MPKGKRIEPLDLDEMAGSSSLNGLMAFRDTPPIGLIPIGVKPIGQARNTQNNSLLDFDTPKPPATRHEASFPPIGSTPIGATPIGSPAASLDDVLSQLSATPPAAKSRGKVIPATKVEDGHSATQNVLYWYLWRKGQQVNGSRSHFVQAGYGQIQAALGIDRSNVQDAVRELQKKLALQVVKASTVGSATVYEVFSCEAILEKRKAEGLIWAHRYGGRRVELLTQSDQEALAGPIGVRPIGLPPRIGLRPTDPVGLAPIEGIGLRPIHTVREVNSKETSSSNAYKIRSFVETTLDRMDDEAAQKLLADCSSRAGNQLITVDQIIDAVRIKLPAAKKAKNPIGFLLAAVPKLFPLPLMQSQPVQEEDLEDFQYWEKVSQDPNAPESLREQAREIISRR